ncbi:ATP-binding protein [Streptomyces sp. NPDC057696]|uniref:ATP-binding protein n=1 Tax=Streptomyces sp. NPDC057696 TaxID=3346218 RepID=UPI0036BA81E6
MSTDTTTSKTKEQGGAQVPMSGPAWDWAAGHGPVTGALSSTTGALALATTGAATGMPPGWALAVGTAGAIGHTVAGIRWRNAGRTIATRAASWLVGAGWTTWAISSGPLSWAALGSLAAIGVGIGTTARSMGLYEEAREEEALASERHAVLMELSAERRKIAAEWTDRIQRVCGITVRVKGVEMWKTGTGFSIDAYLPQGGATWERIASEAPRLSADARLPHGCTATAGPGIDQGRVILDVTTVNVLIETRDYRDDYSPVSIYTGIPWGYRTNAEEICVYLREQCALVVGPTGSGKTNMVHVILAGFARATDVLTFVIDLNAGSAGLSWVLPALNHQPAEGEQEMRPGIDWLASTPEEANRMLDAVLRIGLQRKVSYQDLMAKQNTDQLPISAKIPQIMLVIDEGAEILTSTDRTLKELAKKILEVIRMLRAMGIRTVLTALGATGSVLGNLMIRREAKARVVLTGGEVEGMDLSKVFPGARGLKVTQAPYKGAGFMGTPESPAALFKNWRILPNQIRDIVAATSDRHPVLDAVSIKAAGPVYTTRWDADRIAWMNSTTAAPSPVPAEQGPADGLNLSALHKPDVESEEDLTAKFRQEIDAYFATAPEPGIEQPPASKGLNLSALHNENGTGEQGRESGPDWLATAIDAIKAAGAAGLKPSAVADMVGKDRKTVRAGLQGAVDRGALVYRDNGPHSVYVHPDHA